MQSKANMPTLFPIARPKPHGTAAASTSPTWNVMFVLTLKNTKSNTIDEPTRENLENNDTSSNWMRTVVDISFQDTIKGPKPLIVHRYISNQNRT